MPPRIRTRASKAMKENVDSENNLKPLKNNIKPFRKALADKTNSASDETSVEVPKKTKRVVNKVSTAQPKLKSGVKSVELPRRNRRVPQRFQKDVVTNISKVASPDTTVDSPKPANNNLNTSSRKETPVKNSGLEVSPFKTPSKRETSLVVNRPRRICRLPSRFDDHFVSPNKVIPLQPSNASTPKQPNIVKPTIDKLDSTSKKDTQISKPTFVVKNLRNTTKDVPTKATISPDTNNNANNTRYTRSNKTQPKPAPKKLSPKVNTSQIIVDKSPSPKVLVTKKNSNRPCNTKTVTNKSLSFQVLGGKKKSQECENKDLDVYEFTFDPTEEPQPQKKKRKKPTIKKPKAPKPKTTSSYKSTYDQNISKALSALKKTVQISKDVGAKKLTQIQESSDKIVVSNEQNNILTKTTNMKPEENHITSMNDTGKTSVHGGNYPSIRIEDIAADIEPSLDHHTDLNYSPVNSPRPQSPTLNPVVDPKQTPGRVHNNDPLNLQEDLSFFDDIPVASSSMNMSVRHPLASPWRVEFGSLPIKWHSNAYVKPNMTPAVESSFICTEDSNRKKHVYTNMVPEANESLPQIVADAPALKQTSIISFIKEVAERQAKKKRGRSVSPSKVAVEFNNIDVEGNISTTSAEKVPNNPVSEEVSSNIDTSNDTDNSKENRKTRKRKNNENICEIPAKSPYKEKNNDCTYFGFNVSEDQENVSPAKTKINSRVRSLRPRTRPVLQEINGPTRAVLPLAAKSKIATSSEAVNKVYGELKSAADAPVFPENIENNVTNIEDLTADDSQSVHLFEDIDVVHHLKPTRKSYGKAKKVTFRQPDGDSEEGITQENEQSSFEDDLGDLTFDIPDVKEKKKAKKKRPKKLMSKKEEKEAEEWAAGFNSMCEEIEEFPLMVE